MSNKGTFRDLIVWQKAIEMCKLVYQVSQAMPTAEKFGLVAQMRRAAVSVPSNIAEGNARQSLRDYVHFLIMARGSLAELETQLILARQLRMLNDISTITDSVQETRRILQGLIDSLRNKQQNEQIPKR